MNFHKLMHIWIVGGSQKTIPLVSMFQGGKELENFIRAENKYNDINNIMKPLYRN